MFRGNDPCLCAKDRMIDLTANQREVIIAHKQRGIGPVGKETTTIELDILTATDGDKLELTFVEEVTLEEFHRLRAVEFHNTIGTVVDICLVE